MSDRIVTVTLNPAIDHTAGVPSFQLDAVNRVTWAQADAGGKGVNVASFLAEAGASVSVTGCLGAENLELFEQLFARKELQDHFIRLPGKTRVNIKLVDEAQGQITDVNFPGLVVDRAGLQQVQSVLQKLALTHDWFVFAGSLPAGLPTTTYHDLIATLKSQNKAVVLDTSGEALRQALPTQPDLIKPNIAELEALLGETLTNHAAIITAARQLVGAGIQHVVVSMGADGALFINEHQAIHAQAPAPEIKSTVGAGDAMIAGMVLGLSRGETLADCATLATAFSVGALGQIGPRLPDLAEIEALRCSVRLKHLT
ncbi:MAG: 1-phosphofructokinase [Leptolyngbya sp. SIO4C5]|uniref:1-phosphofructokinase n=1 Tax=Sphaerothrix gracilis TaxID=3151835 RepID=UPI0013C1C2DE|nr:1-phosphofructokinase [Leptolyngbya sp. SIO4C5]